MKLKKHYFSTFPHRQAMPHTMKSFSSRKRSHSAPALLHVSNSKCKQWTDERMTAALKAVEGVRASWNFEVPRSIYTSWLYQRGGCAWSEAWSQAMCVCMCVCVYVCVCVCVCVHACVRVHAHTDRAANLILHLPFPLPLFSSADETILFETLNLNSQASWYSDKPEGRPLNVLCLQQLEKDTIFIGMERILWLRATPLITTGNASINKGTFHCLY